MCAIKLNARHSEVSGGLGGAQIFALHPQSARGLAHAQTRREFRELSANAPASWSTAVRRGLNNCPSLFVVRCRLFKRYAIFLSRFAFGGRLWMNVEDGRHRPAAGIRAHRQ
jgi:hypothetical protein